MSLLSNAREGGARGDELLTRYDILRLEGSGAAFDEAALDTFRFQARACAPYREYVEALGVDAQSVRRVEDIPFLPVEVFKHRDVYGADAPPEAVFTSSATGAATANPGATASVLPGGGGEAGALIGRRARHPVASLSAYERTFTTAFRTFYGAPESWSIYALLPGYLEREGSSLIYMVRGLGGRFYLRDHDALLRAMASDPRPKILLGVSYALWELAETRAPRLTNTIVMETGGMKGRREELPREAFHRLLGEAFGVASIHSEYGMAELSSQAYSAGGGVFRTPGWMRVMARDVNDPFARPGTGVRGGLDVIDLANRHSCSFLQTQDMGRVSADGSFTVDGRIAGSDIRGCNLLIQ